MSSAGGAVEFQKQSTPHFHGNVSIRSVYQHKTLQDIGVLIESNLLSVDAIKSVQSWVCREEHLNQEMHDQDMERMAKVWHTNYEAREHDPMSRLPAYVAHDSAATMWGDSVSEGASRATGTRRQYLLLTISRYSTTYCSKLYLLLTINRYSNTYCSQSGDTHASQVLCCVCRVVYFALYFSLSCVVLWFLI